MNKTLSIWAVLLGFFIDFIGTEVFFTVLYSLAHLSGADVKTLYYNPLYQIYAFCMGMGFVSLGGLCAAARAKLNPILHGCMVGLFSELYFLSQIMNKGIGDSKLIVICLGLLLSIPMGALGGFIYKKLQRT